MTESLNTTWILIVSPILYAAFDVDDVTLLTVGRIPSITRAEPFTNELPPEPIGSGSVKVASFPAISLIVPPFNVNGVYPELDDQL